jgi:hypothetical protein
LPEEFTLSVDASRIRAQLDGLEAASVTEFVYQPKGPNIQRELERFIVATQRVTPPASPVYPYRPSPSNREPWNNMEEQR